MRHPWVLAALAVLVISALFVVVSDMRPAFDAYGWLVWGQRALHLNLDTNAAPSWKPLTFLFTFPYALTGPGALWLWMVTAVSGALAGAVFAGRIAYRLVGDAPGREYARIIAAVFAACGVLGIAGYWHQVLIATADPMDITLCLAAIDFHLSGRRRAAWVMVVLISLGRPEAWPLGGLYAIWLWHAIPTMRRLLALGVAVVPVLWFGIAALSSRSWFIASDVALGSTKVLPGAPVSRLPSNFLGLYELPMKLAVLAALGLALMRRERTWLLLAGTAGVWLATWTALALHGWNPASRYLFEPAAVLIVLTGAAVGWVLASAPRGTLLRWVAVACVLALVASLAPDARMRARLAHNGIVRDRTWAHRYDRLHAVILKVGAKRILACGRPVSYLGFQTVLAWELGTNVSDIWFRPGPTIRKGIPVVFLQPSRTGWRVRPFHARQRSCRRLASAAAAS